MKKAYLLLFAGFIFSCNQIEKKEAKDEVLNLDKAEIKSEVNVWYDSLVKYYISKSDKESIKDELNSKVELDWEIERFENQDSANYFMVKIGHHMSDDGKNMRFTADGWICLDSISKKIYEYDVANDTLIEWKK